MMKKIGALLLALVMMLAVSLTAVASPAELNENNEEGVAGNWNNADDERGPWSSVNIKKVIKAYNPNETTVNAPVITYTYTVTGVTVDETVTDEATDHDPERQVVAPVNKGITTGLVVTGTDAGTAGDATSAVGTLVFTNASTWTTDVAGDENEYDIKLDFTNVNFTQPGVYRYQIDETVSPDYDKAAMEDGAYDTVYLDVYVDGEFNIYGYVCMKTSDSVTDSTKKINGFVDGSDGDGTDKYYTYDLVLSKDVENDTYGQNHAFPFTVIFSNPEGYTSTFTVLENAGTGSNGISPATASAPTWSGVAKVKEGGNITITGIPAGVDVDVYETNDMTGVTYAVSTSVNGDTAVTDDSVNWGTAPTTATAQTTQASYESQDVKVDTTKIAAVSAQQTVAITNSLLLISPTGVVMRIAPYALILAAGIVLLLISRRRKAAAEEE